MGNVLRVVLQHPDRNTYRQSVCNIRTDTLVQFVSEDILHTSSDFLHLLVWASLDLVVAVELAPDHTLGNTIHHVLDTTLVRLTSLRTRGPAILAHESTRLVVLYRLKMVLLQPQVPNVLVSHFHHQILPLHH